jgi:HprK-related kinase A
MTTLSELPKGEVRRRLHSDGLVLQTGPLHVRIRSDVPAVEDGLCTLYGDYPAPDPGIFCEASVQVAFLSGLRRWVRPIVQFLHDGRPVFEPMPADHALPLTEWALNWAVGSQAHHYLILHAAVIERNGLAVLLPAPPGSGKSTLCAALIFRGWRLLSDELTLVDLNTSQLLGPVRPISLKNQSIEIIRSFADGPTMSRPTQRTAKGTVALLRASRVHVEQALMPATPRWIIFPRYQDGTEARLTARTRADTLMQLSRNAFNSGVTAREGFHALADVVAASDCYDYTYSRLDDAIAQFDELANGVLP